ncbi:hypothetical protein BBP40_005329 [Aspergillus hancockii]|nr:hypothetical protein BBP40_005329 [Aspergillus hancockii]
MLVDNVESPPFRRPCRATDAEHASIHAIIRDNPGRRLYVPPIAWTLTQLQFLDCRFILQEGRPPKESRPSRPSLPGHVRDSASYPVTLRAITQLAEPGEMEFKKFAVEGILYAFDIQPLDFERLPFYYNRQAVARVRPERVFSHSFTSSILAYISFNKIQSLRWKYTHVSLCKKPSAPVSNLKEKKLRSIEPQNPNEDPYIVATLISLAQEQRRQQQPKVQEAKEIATPNSKDVDGYTTAGASPSSTTLLPCQGIEQTIRSTPQSFKVLLVIQYQKVNLLAFADAVPRFLYVYTATIPAEFLDKFDEPLRFSPSCPVAVEYRLIPLDTPNCVLEKLHRLLCPGSCRLCAGDETRSTDPGCRDDVESRGESIIKETNLDNMATNSPIDCSGIGETTPGSLAATTLKKSRKEQDTAPDSGEVIQPARPRRLPLSHAPLPGVAEIYIFGFSLGAYTALFLADMLDNAGLLGPNNEEMIPFIWHEFRNGSCPV